MSGIHEMKSEMGMSLPETDPNFPWLVHWKDPKTSKWIGEYKAELYQAKAKVDCLERLDGVNSVYIQHIDGEVVYHLKDGEQVI